tara:strand:+ start:454 stop:822 length:369 start_codon:yes stop_codon:yes gene_type:complete
MQDNFSIRDWKNETVYKEEFEEGSKMAEQNDFEADAEDIEFEIPGGEDAKPVVDKSLNKSLNKQDKVIKAYQDINAQMQAALQDFKTAEGDAKEVAKDTLKSLTPAYRAAKDAYETLKGIKL